MPALRGKDFLLKQGDGASPEVFTTIAALRGTSLSINGETVDVSTKDSFISGTLWRELLDGGGVRSLSLSADGVYTDDQSQQDMADSSLDGANGNFQIDDGSRIWEGAFQVTSYEQSGGHEGEQTFSITLESSGEITITTP